MGFGRVIWSGIVGMVFLAVFSWISFAFLGLTSNITNGLIENLEDALAQLGTLLPVLGPFLGVLVGAFLGVIMICFFPIHWCIFYRPDDVMLLISVMLPWILAGVVTAAISAHSPRGGIHSALAIGIGYAIPMVAIFFLLPFIVGLFLPGGAELIRGIFNGLSAGLTDLPYLFAVFMALLQGSLIAAVFGAFIGALKYKPQPGGVSAAKGKKKKGKEEAEYREPTLDEPEEISSTDDLFCTNCGAKFVDESPFCTNCGAKKT